MPSQYIWEKFNQIITVSKVFQLMDQVQQATFLAEFEQSSDQQLLKAIQAIQEQDDKLNQSEQAQLAQAQKQIILAEQLNLEIKNSQKALLISEEAEGNQKDAQDLQSIELQLQVKTPPASTNNTKFLGLF